MTNDGRERYIPVVVANPYTACECVCARSHLSEGNLSTSAQRRRPGSGADVQDQGDPAQDPQRVCIRPRERDAERERERESGDSLRLLSHADVEDQRDPAQDPLRRGVPGAQLRGEDVVGPAGGHAVGRADVDVLLLLFVGQPGPS